MKDRSTNKSVRGYCRRLVARLLPLTLVCAFTTPAAGIRAQLWSHTTEADFDVGQLDNIVVTNLGDLKLAAGTQVISELPGRPSIIYDIQDIGNSVYLAGGPEAKLIRQEGNEFAQVLELKGEQVFALDIYEGNLLICISGPTSRLAVLNDGHAETLIELPGVRYVWDAIVDGNIIYLATGTEGKLLRVALSVDPDEQLADSRISVLLDTDQSNLLCLGQDGHGRLYTGTDSDGLIYRLHFVDGVAKSFVLYDAPEPEIGALLVMKDGTVYAGTADANQAKPGRLGKPKEIQAGRPEPQNQSDKDSSGLPKDREQPQPFKEQSAKSADKHAQLTHQVNALWLPLPGRPSTQASALHHRLTPLAEGNQISDTVDQEEKNQSARPTAQQYDRLRQVIKQQLQTSRQGDQLQAVSGTAKPQSIPMARANHFRPAKKQISQRKPGNAVYRIGLDNYVTQVFRESVTILRIASQEDKLIVATGNEGQIYRVDPLAEETTILADLEPQQVPAMLMRDDHILLGTANPALLIHLDDAVARQGKYTSKVLDAAHISKWGKLHLTADIAAQTAIKIELRSGNVHDPDHSAWSNWSDPITLNYDAQSQSMMPIELPVTTTPARFLQYRLNLIGDGQATPVIDKVQITYVVPNLKPRIESIQATYPGQSRSRVVVPGQPLSPGGPVGGNEPKHVSSLNIFWKARDPNNDQLTYQLEYRPAAINKWLPLAEDLTASKYVWKTQLVPDGWYIIRIVAGDHASNTPDMAMTSTRHSDPILIDNTAPLIENDIQVALANGKTILKLMARDALSPIAAVHWAVDGDGKWQPALPGDLIYDSTTEQIKITIADLAPGMHVISLRLIDARGNALYRAQLVRVE